MGDWAGVREIREDHIWCRPGGGDRTVNGALYPPSPWGPCFSS